MHKMQQVSFTSMYIRTLQGGPKNGTIYLRLITSPIINRFSKLFHCQNQETICNETVTIDLITPQVCRYTTSLNVMTHSSRQRH